MEIDNKTKATVLREIANNNIVSIAGDHEFASRCNYEADKLDPPEKPIHPHEGCEGMVVYYNNYTTLGVYRAGDIPGKHTIPRQASKVPAFLCDGTRPEWVKDDDIIWFPWLRSRKISTADCIGWGIYAGNHFCVLNPVEVE